MMHIVKKRFSSFFTGKRRVGAGWLSLLAFLITACAVTSQAALKTKTIPVRVHLLSFEAAPSLNSTVGENDVRQLFEEANRIWAKAGIQWQIESIQSQTVASRDFPPVSEREERRAFRKKLKKISPPVKEKKMWQVAIFRQFPIKAGGLYVGEAKTVFYGELNKDGLKKPLILAHELGHALGLDHVEDTRNLMYGGSGKDADAAEFLDDAQIKTARSQADKGPAPPNAMPQGGDKKRQGPQGMMPDAMSQERMSSGAMDSGREAHMIERMKRFDRDGDGKVHKADVPAKAQRAFARLDRNGDGWLDEDELKGN